MQLTQYKCFFSCKKQIELLSELITKFLSNLMSKWPVFLFLKFHIAAAMHFDEPGSQPFTLLVHVCPFDTKGKPTTSHSGSQVTSLYLLKLSFLVLLFHIKYLVMFLTSFSDFVMQKQGKWLMHHQPTPSVSQENILQFPSNRGLQFENCFIFCNIFNLQDLSSVSRGGSWDC